MTEHWQAFNLTITTRSFWKQCIVNFIVSTKMRFVDYHNLNIVGWKMVVFLYNFQLPYNMQPRFNPVPAMLLWHDPCKLQRLNQMNHKECRKRARKATGLITLTDIELSFESKCEWINTKLLLYFLRFCCVSLRRMVSWNIHFSFSFPEFAQISWSYNNSAFFKGITSFAECRILR